MPIIGRKRRAPTQDDDDDESPDVQQTQTQVQRRQTPPEDDFLDDEDAAEVLTANGLPTDQMVKKLVRLALAHEYARRPIRRQDIVEKVLGNHSRQFKNVFNEAQMQLRATFGMEMVELPLREKVSLREKRAAQKNESKSTSSNSWALTSTLPAKYRHADIITPPAIPIAEVESQYVGLYTFVISCIYISGGQLSETKLDSILRKMNAEHSTPIDKTEKVLARMSREGYIYKSKGEIPEDNDWVVAPRGKIEVGEEGVANLVRTIYGNTAPSDLERRLERSLKPNERPTTASAASRLVGTKGPMQSVGGARRGRGRPRRGGTRDDDGDE
ncbi:MAGE family-domain-containing protein [Lineolata rhizophorae]|uniref:MAGE family-domain-containing protein n=1 Tax=Lineolata rhizophorae TaxID=578093 RepID=A0A6A6NXG2_9PEZI|nr:MAGE family-domain-containing protein [Lineolata rhizophorae]